MGYRRGPSSLCRCPEEASDPVRWPTESATGKPINSVTDRRIGIIISRLRDPTTRVYIYRGGYASGGYCHRGSHRHGMTTSSGVNQSFGGMGWASDGRYSGQRYCVHIRNQDGNYRTAWSTTTSPILGNRVTSRNISVDGPRATVMGKDQPRSTDDLGYVRLYRRGRTYRMAAVTPVEIIRVRPTGIRYLLAETTSLGRHSAMTLAGCSITTACTWSTVVDQGVSISTLGRRQWLITLV